jgi:hypothetical protein
LQKAFLGNLQGLGRLGVGLTKAELKTGNFADITQKLTDLFAGQAERQANSFKGSIDKLSVAANNASEIIGTGLIAALQGLGEDESINDLTSDIEDFATEISKSIQAIGLLLGLLKKVPELLKDTGGPLFKLPKGLTGAIFDLEKLFKFTGVGALSGIFDFLTKPVAGGNMQGLLHLAELQSNYAAVTLSTNKKLTAEQLKQLKAKQLQAAIDKANKALGKGTGVFDLDKIQLAAAEKAAAEQLGKATSEAQLLAITNDLARLQVKEDMLALEDAIASKDVAAIAAATAKLNGDLLILGALTNQEVKLLDIEEILSALLPKELIDLANLDEAIAKLIALSKIVINPIVPVAPVQPKNPNDNTATTPEEIADLIKDRENIPISGPSDPRVLYGGMRPNPGGGYEAFDPARGGMTSGGSRPNQSNNTTTVTITVNESLDPNLTATRIQKILTDSANNTGNVYDLGTGSKNTSYVV